MAAIGKIREHSVALLVIVGVAMLAFIVGDFLSSSSSFYNRRREYVGEVEGKSIHYTDYEAAKDQLTEVYKIESGRTDLDEDMTYNLRNQVWQMMVSDRALTAQAEKIGLGVTPDELYELCAGDHIHQIIRSRRTFFDQTGNFNRMYLVQFLASLEQADETADQASLQQAKTYWMYWENAVRLTYLQEKYVGLAQGLLGANSLDAKYAFDAAQTTADIEFVQKPYFAVADSLVKVSESDIKALYKQNQKLYKQQPNRGIQYVTFDVVPSEDDFTEAEAALKKLQEEFYTTEDVLSVVNLNSDITYNGMNFSEDMVPAQYKEFAFAKGAKTGDVTELTFDEATQTYAMARLVEAGYALPDSILLIAVGDSIEEELGWFTEAQMGKEMADKAYATAKGQTFTMTQGMQEMTFKVGNKSAATPKVKLAILARTVTPSSKTYAAIYNAAKQFIVENNTEDKFIEGAQAAGKMVSPAYNLLKTTDKVADLKSSRAIVRWAFEAKQGAVSDVFDCGQQFVVATLSEISEGEYRDLKAVEPELRFQVLNDKKAEYLTKQLQGKSLEEAAQVLGAEIQTAEAVSLSSFRMGAAGAEPAAIGAAVALAQGQTSAPVKGVQGIYVVRSVAKTTAEAEFDAKSWIAQLNARSSYSLPYQVLGLIEQNAEIVDNRPNFQ